MSTIEWPPLVMGGVKMADSHVGNTLLNRPWLQAIRDVEAGTPVAEVWMTEAEAEAYHLEHAGRVLAPAVKAAAIGGRWYGVQLQDELLTYEAFVASRELQTFEPSRRRAYARYVAEWAEHASTIAGSVRPCGGIGENERMMNAADLAYQAAFCDGGHHKQWYLDQMLRCLLGDAYEHWRQKAEAAGLEWDEGIRP